MNRNAPGRISQCICFVRTHSPSNVAYASLADFTWISLALQYSRRPRNSGASIFTPYQPLGFRIALFGFSDFGLLGRDANIFKNNFYTTFGLGVRLRNERLVFSTIQLRLGVALGKGGWADCRYFQASNGTRMEQYRYLPSRPEIVRFR